MKNSSIHTSWLSWFIGSVLLVILLWYTGYLDFLISRDSIGIGFSIFLVLTLLNAAYSQYQSFKAFDRNQYAVAKVHKILKKTKNYEEKLADLIEKGPGADCKETPLEAFFLNLRRLIHLNPHNPISETNLETAEIALDDAFHINTSNEVEQAQNLTILGMLGTFLGILWGFASIDWASVSADNAFEIVVGVMSGISIALITSILGILFSLFLKKMHKRLESKHRAEFMVIAVDIQEMSRVLCHKEPYLKISKKVSNTMIKDH